MAILSGGDGRLPIQGEVRFPPYQYKDKQCVHEQGTLRPFNIAGREVILGFRLDYTVQCMPKSEHGSVARQDCRCMWGS